MSRYLCLTISSLMFAMIPTKLTAAEKVDFARDIRPVLSNRCYKCHGPAVQKGKLRLDSREAAIEAGAIVPGKPDASSLIERICEPNDDNGRMPPAEVGPRLSAREITHLRNWIEQGAVYTPHWAFTQIARPAVPPTRFPVQNEIDHFIFARLQKERLSPSPQADKTTLIRRVTLDLTGLLPTVQEVDDFLKDRSPQAYEKVVDRLLASPHYGERQARHWLDLARYADSNGYTIDGPRSIWPYRDWVISALNNDMPFDQFTIEQLAGDMLPHATLEQKIATGFHRNTSYNEEGGTDAEQFRVERTIDRTNTTGAVWLGLTVGCAQCHNHKYDPFTQKDYYRLLAFFNSADEPTIPISGRPDIENTIEKLHHMEFYIQKNGGSREDIAIIKAEVKRVKGKAQTTLVMRERSTPRKSYVMLRGDFLRHGEEVQPGYPEALVAKTDTPRNRSTRKLTRLDLAKWLVNRENPLTARVTVNREWQKFFGLGLVETENDFGMQSSLPTHPELVNWLAVEFMERGWSLKHLHKLIVMSATYQQSSTMRKDLTAKDPRNFLLGRQNRLRLEAEAVRDVALCASGLLNPKLGGPGVYPAQAKEVFSFTQSKRNWVVSKGTERFRRGMYTYIWRQSQHPLLTTFDGADAQTACTRRNRSNTPLQALHLANDPVFIELAEGLSKRISKDGAKDDDTGKVRLAYRLCFSREPNADELQRVLAYLNLQRHTDPKTAWSAVARVLMNLDEFITRE